MAIETTKMKRALVALLLSFALSVPAFAQGEGSADWRATRAQLETAAASLERAAASPAYGAATQAKARERLAVVRRRLSEGDFSVGERLFVQVRSTSVAVNDTLTVLDSLWIDVPGVRRVSLAGVLRSEVEGVVTRSVQEVVRGATVRATPMMRIGVLGEVTRPGFQNVPATTLLDQLLTNAGGPTLGAELTQTRILRDGEELMDGDEFMKALSAGRSLITSQLQDGDIIEVPTRRPPWSREATLQIVSIVLAPLITFLLVR